MRHLRNASQLLLGAALVYAGIGHLTTSRLEFQAQVPTLLKDYADFVVLASGAVEISLGAGLIALWKYRVQIGWLVALFFIAIFWGNISQYLNHTDAFGLNSDRARAIVHSGDPEAIVAVILAQLLVVTGVETEGDKAHFLAEGTEQSSIALGVGLMEHCLGLRDRATVAGFFIGLPPSGENDENRIFRRDYNERLAIKLVDDVIAKAAA